MPEIRFKGDSGPVRIGTIFCIGRNYAEHAAELNNPIPKQPLVFLKPASAIIHSNSQIILPASSQSVHYEVELVVVIGKSVKNISADEANDAIMGFGIGIDITARDIQQKAKDKGHPWTVAKGYDTFAPVSDFVSTGDIEHPQAIDLSLSVNGKIEQHGNTRDMLFPINNLIAYLTTIFTLYPGDLIFTGTPSGVGELQAGDRLLAELGEKITDLSVNVISG